MNVDPIEYELLKTRCADNEKRIDALLDELTHCQKELERLNAIDRRKNSIEVQTVAKGGNFKHYFDPSAKADENDEILAETVRIFLNAGGTLPERFKQRIAARANEIEEFIAGQ